MYNVPGSDFKFQSRQDRIRGRRIGEGRHCTVISIHKYRYGAAVILTAAVVQFTVSCISSDGASKPAVGPAAKRIRTALYLDQGSLGSGVFHWARLLHYSPQIELRFVNGEDIRGGKLDELDLLVMPGGDNGKQCMAMAGAGREKVRGVIRAGGGYVGTCAGLACTLNDKYRLKLLPFSRKPDAGGKTAILAVDFSPEGAKRMDLAPGRYFVRYSGGPIPVPGKAVPGGSGEILAVYRSTTSYCDKPEGNFFNEGAVICGTLGKGKVIATGFHPEYWEVSRPIVAGCIYAVTGVKPVFEFPAKRPRALRVGFWSSGTPDARRIRDMLEVDGNPEVDLMLVASHEVEQGMLRHLDVLIVAHDIHGSCKKHLSGKFVRSQIRAFLDRGGKIVVSGNGNECVPRHRNVIEVPVGSSLAQAALGKY